MSPQDLSLQERFAPQNICFGCGQANEQGLRIRSFPRGTDPYAEVFMEWMPASHHEAFDQVLNGGIIGTLLDCHSNWTAIWHLICRDGLEHAPACVTAEYHVKMRRPTPSRQKLQIVSQALSSSGPRVEVEAILTSGGQITATSLGTFVAVGPGHPAFDRW